MRQILLSIAVVAAGGAIGSLVRWFLGLRLNALFSGFALGTLAANLLAAYLIGIAIGVFIRYPAIAPEWRLFIVTGLLGGLSTFSSFSAESLALLQHGRLGAFGIHLLAHVFGSLALALAGTMTAAGLFGG